MSRNSELLFVLLMSFGRMLPMFIVWLVGLVIAIVRWPRYPVVSLLVIGATLVAGLASITSQAFFTVLPHFSDGADFSRLVSIVGFVSVFVHACAWACLLAAAFVGRGASVSPDSSGGAADLPNDKPR